MRVLMPDTRFIIAVVAALAIGACSSGDSASEMDTADPTPPAGEHGGMAMDSAAMQQHAQEADSVVRAMRQHADRLRQLPPAEWPARMNDHVARVAGMLAMMDRHIREMNVGMGSGHEHMSEMMGMTAEDHTAMMAEMGALRADAETLQTATAAQVTQLMPAHLDRLERMLSMMERGAAHMRAGATQ
ncbi:hypothetical protein BH23GEM9_BH23GEM9_20380 [soil metagenome]